MKKSFLTIMISLAATYGVIAETVIVEAEGFTGKGGWNVDQQFMDQMGSPFLLAHGYGKPVEDARTVVTFQETGEYRVWVRTRDWVGQWKKKDTPDDIRADGFPGIFNVLIDGNKIEKEFGRESAEWGWEDGGVVKIDKKSVEVIIHDLVGFDGRCDAILFTTDKNLKIPNKDPEMAQFRRKLLGYPEKVPDAGNFDMVVVGGGMAGACAAISGARQGLKVALIQDRPVIGGNNSSEIRVHLGGRMKLPPYPAIGRILAEIDPEQHGNANPAEQYKDEKKLAVVENEKNISLFLNTHVNNVEKDGKSMIKAVIGQDIETGRRLRFPAEIFVDCTGDGTVGYLSGADYRLGREAKSETDEERAEKTADTMTMGTSIMWYAVDGAEDFPLTPWAAKFNSRSCQKTIKGNWDWETGMMHHQVDDFEYIRDYGLRVVFGNWSFQKNNPELKQQYANNKLGWVAYIGGKRESRRLLGDVILTQQDVVDAVDFPDACVTTTWTIDLHYPVEVEGFDGEPFRSTAKHTKISPYPIPYRCLYSRNIDNLMMAGRNISVTHVALGTIRVMRTTGMMGEVCGLAAAVCKKHSTTPRGVYEKHLDELKGLMSAGMEPGEYYNSEIVVGIAGKACRTGSYAIDSIPEELATLPCVTVDRGDSAVPAEGYVFKIDKKSDVYIAVHDRGGYVPPKEWIKTDMTMKWFKTHTDTVYKLSFDAGVVKIPGHAGKEGPHFGIPHMTMVKSTDGDVKITKSDN